MEHLFYVNCTERAKKKKESVSEVGNRIHSGSLIAISRANIVNEDRRPLRPSVTG